MTKDVFWDLIDKSGRDVGKDEMDGLPARYAITGQTGIVEWESGEQGAGGTTNRQRGWQSAPAREAVGRLQRPAANNGGGARPCRQARMQAAK